MALCANADAERNQFTECTENTFVWQWYESDTSFNLLATSVTGDLTGDEFMQLELSNIPNVIYHTDISLYEIHFSNSTLTNCSIGNKVQHLEFRYGRIETIDLSDATAMEFLNLEGSSLKQRSPRSLNLQHAEHLKILDLREIKITGTFNWSLPSSLIYLDLSRNQHTNLENDVFKDLIRNYYY